jgi:tRNA A37 threonylcarbamoyladenosine synthetase subunit TsaC/SUA5/YrdC
LVIGHWDMEEKIAPPLPPTTNHQLPAFYTQKIFLVQTDTTVGFLSQNAARLEHIKSRQGGKPFLRVFASLKAYKASGGRIPSVYRSQVRRAHKSTFVVKNQAFRIVAEGPHHTFLQRFGWMFSTSANRSGEKFDRTFCEPNADIIVEDVGGLHESAASTILRLGRYRSRRLR